MINNFHSICDQDSIKQQSDISTSIRETSPSSQGTTEVPSTSSTYEISSPITTEATSPTHSTHNPYTFCSETNTIGSPLRSNQLITSDTTPDIEARARRRNLTKTHLAQLSLQYNMPTSDQNTQPQTPAYLRDDTQTTATEKSKVNPQEFKLSSAVINKKFNLTKELEQTDACDKKSKKSENNFIFVVQGSDTNQPSTPAISVSNKSTLLLGKLIDHQYNTVKDQIAQEKQLWWKQQNRLEEQQILLREQQQLWSKCQMKIEKQMNGLPETAKQNLLQQQLLLLEQQNLMLKEIEKLHYQQQQNLIEYQAKWGNYRKKRYQPK